MIFKHVDSNHINIDSNNLNCVDLNGADLNQLIPANSTTINELADVCELNQLLPWDGGLMDAAASTVSTRTPLSYVPSI